MSHGSTDHLRAPRWQWWLVVLSGMLTLVFGTIGVAQYECEHLHHVHGLSPLYHAAQMLILHTSHFDKGWNLWIEAGRWFGALTLFGATLAILWARFRSEIMLFRIGAWSDHFVICGLGRKGFELARCLKANRPVPRVVVIDPQPDPELAARCAENRIGVITGDAATPRALKQARADRAREIIVVTPSDETNVRIAAELRAVRSGANAQPAVCHVHLSDIHLREALMTSTDHRNEDTGELHFFDVFDDEARRVLLELPLDGEGIGEESGRSVHVAIFGFGRMGRSIALRAAKMGHFANGKPLRLSIVDRAATLQRDRFLFRYPEFGKNSICQTEFHEAEAESQSVGRLIEQWAGEPETLLHVFVCLSEDARTVEMALRLRTMLEGRAETNLLVRAHTHHSLARVFDTISSEHGRLTLFGMTEDTCSMEAIRREYNEALARAIHEQFVLSRRSDSERRPDNDPALRPWEQLREDIRESNRQQADHIPIKLRAIGCQLDDLSSSMEPITKFSAEEVEVLARMEHARWNAERWIAGWRYGKPSDKSRRINENLASWEDLTEPVRGYDREAVARIPELLKQVRPPRKVIRPGLHE